MKRCANSHKGCPELARGGAVHYCADCYRAWQDGGYGAVQASIDAKRAPTEVHECVGTAKLAEKDGQIAALQTEVAEYAAFKAEVVALYTTNFMGKITLPDPDSLLARIGIDRMVAQTARTVMHKDGHAPARGTPVNLRGHLTVQWLKNVQRRLGFREAVAGNLRTHISQLEADVAETGDYVPGDRAFAAGSRRAVNNKHPSAKQPVELDLSGRKQLDRIESLAKLSAAYSPFWPHTYGVLLGAALASTYLLW